jgi:hypothetical protein
MSDFQNAEWKEQGERFLLFIKKLGLNQTQAAEIVGTKQSGISRCIKGKIGLPEKWVLRLVEHYNKTNKMYLLKGEGEMFLPDKNIKSYNLLADAEYERVEEPVMSAEVIKELSAGELHTLVLRLVYRVEELERRVRELEGLVGK